MIKTDIVKAPGRQLHTLHVSLTLKSFGIHLNGKPGSCCLCRHLPVSRQKAAACHCGQHRRAGSGRKVETQGGQLPSTWKGPCPGESHGPWQSGTDGQSPMCRFIKKSSEFSPRRDPRISFFCYSLKCNLPAVKGTPLGVQFQMCDEFTQLCHHPLCYHGTVRVWNVLAPEKFQGIF